MSRKYQVLSIKILFFVALLFSTGHKAFARTFLLSSDAYISLITCSPGTELYSAFGHSALRIYDPINRFDRVYNYGTFDFDQLNFYSNYAMGRPIFMLSASSTKRFMAVYEYENRSVVEDILNLTQEQKQRLFELLEENYLPKNREYRYDYIYDNCSTRIRDMLMKVTNGTLVFDTTRKQPVYSFRQLMDLYLKPQPWGDLGIDIALSSVIDTPTTPYYYMFLPDFLRDEVRHANIVEGRTSTPLVKASGELYVAEQQPEEKSILTPLFLCCLLFAVFLAKTIFEYRKNAVRFVAFDMSLFAVIGVVGIAIAHISFFSDHHAARNYNLLWAIPTHFIFAFLLPFRKKLKWVNSYFLLTAIITAIAFIGGLTFIPQLYNVAFYPLMLTLIMRSAMIWKMAR